MKKQKEMILSQIVSNIKETIVTGANLLGQHLIKYVVISQPALKWIINPLDSKHVNSIILAAGRMKIQFETKRNRQSIKWK